MSFLTASSRLVFRKDGKWLVFIEWFGPLLEAFFSLGVDGFVDGFGLVD